MSVTKMLLEKYAELKDHGGWRAVGEFYGVSAGMAYRVAKEGYEPKDPTIRANLGMTAKAELDLLPGVKITPKSKLGSSSRTCDCGGTFVPNTAKRHKCFKCVPIRRRKK